MFNLSDAVTISGIEYPVRTDFRVILEIFVMLDDPDLSDADKSEALLRMFYAERPPDAESALQAFTDFVDPRHGSQGKKPSGGLPVWANLMLAITDEVQSALRGELAAREQRIAKYVEKYQNK